MTTNQTTSAFPELADLDGGDYTRASTSALIARTIAAALMASFCRTARRRSMAPMRSRPVVGMAAGT